MQPTTVFMVQEAGSLGGAAPLKIRFTTRYKDKVYYKV